MIVIYLHIMPAMWLIDWLTHSSGEEFEGAWLDVKSRFLGFVHGYQLTCIN